MSNFAKRTLGLTVKYYNARKSSLAIMPISFDEDSSNYYENYYILLDARENPEYTGQMHIIELRCRGSKTKSYPNYAPQIKFITPIFHPNISSSGTICVDFLTNAAKWSPSYGFESIINAIFLLFNEPNPASPYNGTAARAWVAGRKLGKKIIKENNLKGKEAIKVENKSMDEYRRLAYKHYVPTEIKKYAKWFPQIENKPPIDNWTKYASRFEKKLMSAEQKNNRKAELMKKRRAKFKKKKEAKINNKLLKKITDKMNNLLITSDNMETD